MIWCDEKTVNAIPDTIKNKMIEQLSAQRQHRMSEWKLAVKKTWEQLREIEDNNLLGESKTTREERLQNELSFAICINTSPPAFDVK